jgi:L-rhamnose mutarotase
MNNSERFSSRFPQGGEVLEGKGFDHEAFLALRMMREKPIKFTVDAGAEPEAKKARQAGVNMEKALSEQCEVILGAQEKWATINWEEVLPSTDRSAYHKAYRFLQEKMRSMTTIPADEEETKQLFHIEETEDKKSWKIGTEKITKPQVKNEELLRSMMELFLNNPNPANVRKLNKKKYMWTERWKQNVVGSHDISEDRPATQITTEEARDGCEWVLRLRQKNSRSDDAWYPWLAVKRRRSRNGRGQIQFGLFAERRFEDKELIGFYVGSEIWTGRTGQQLPKWKELDKSLMYVANELKCVYLISRDRQPCLVSPVFEDEEGGSMNPDMLFGFRYMTRGGSTFSNRGNDSDYPNVRILENGLILAHGTIKKGQELIGFTNPG